MTKTTKSVVRKYCNKCKYHHPGDEACPQATPTAGEKTLGDMIDFMALQNQIINLQDQILKVGQHLASAQTKIADIYKRAEFKYEP